MATTTSFVTAPAGSWQLASDSLENVLISSELSVPAHVFVGETVPDANSAFHVVRAGYPFAISGIASAKVYVRSGVAYGVPLTVTKG